MKNIELFDEYVAKIFGDLYENFPIPIAVNACKISGYEDTDEYGTPVDSEGVAVKDFEVCKATIDWLIEAGYLRAKNGNQYGYSQCVLTAKGLEVLKSVPDSVVVKTSLGDKLIVALRKGATGAATEAGKTAIRIGAGLLPGGMV